jgi:hypothetical protein
MMTNSSARPTKRLLSLSLAVKDDDSNTRATNNLLAITICTVSRFDAGCLKLIAPSDPTPIAIMQTEIHTIQ